MFHTKVALHFSVGGSLLCMMVKELNLQQGHSITSIGQDAGDGVCVERDQSNELAEMAIYRASAQTVQRVSVWLLW